MKRAIYLMVAMLVCVASFSQELYEQELPLNDQGLIEYSDVVDVEGASADELYSRAREWFVKTYNSAEDVLQMDDRESGKLIGKAFNEIYTLMLGTPSAEKLYYTISVYVREGRYKYVISNIEIQGYVSQYNLNPPRAPIEMLVITNLYKKNGKPRKYQATVKEEMIKSIDSLIGDLISGMEGGSVVVSSDDDW